MPVRAVIAFSFVLSRALGRSQDDRGASESTQSYLSTGVTPAQVPGACASRPAVAFVFARPNVAMDAAPSLASSITTRLSYVLV